MLSHVRVAKPTCILIQISLLEKDVPNILNPCGVPPRAVVSLQGLDDAYNRLRLFGGMPGLLSHMRKDQVGVT